MFQNHNEHKSNSVFDLYHSIQLTKKKSYNSCKSHWYLKFCKPHHRQYKYLSRNFEETTFLSSASLNMPNLKGMDPLISSPGSQFSSTLWLIAQFCTFEQLKKSKLHFAASTFLHSVFQHVVSRSMDRRYHDAPKTYMHERRTNWHCLIWKLL